MKHLIGFFLLLFSLGFSQENNIFERISAVNNNGKSGITLMAIVLPENNPDTNLPPLLETLMGFEIITSNKILAYLNQLQYPFLYSMPKRI